MIKRPVQVVQVAGSYKVPFHIKDADGVLLAHVTGDQLSPEGTSIGKARAIAQEIADALNARPEEGWREVDSFEGVLKHCGSRGAVKIEMEHGVFGGVFCYHAGKFYAYRLPLCEPQREPE